MAGGHAEIEALLAVIDPVTSDGDDHLQEAQMDLLGYLGLDKPEAALRHDDPRIAPVLQRIMESGPQPLRQWARETIEDNPPPSPQAS